MTPRVKRGLEVAKDLLRKHVHTNAFTRNSICDAGALLEAVEWIAHQQAIDERRRKERR